MRVKESLNRLERIYFRLREATLSDQKPEAGAIIALRQEFAIEYGSFMLALNEDIGVTENHALHTSLKDKMDTLRIRLMSYTMAWQPRQIQENPQAYRDAAETIADLVGNFIASTRQQLQVSGVD